MDALLNALDALVNQDPNMAQAADNIRNDLRSEQHPYGLSEELQSRLNASIEDGADLRETVNSHRSIDTPELHVEAEIPTDGMRRVMSLSSFYQYHFMPPKSESSFDTAGDSPDLLIDFVNRYFPELRDAHADQSETAVDSEEFGGTTGRPRNPTWWTWLEGDDAPPDNGETYMLELNLSEREHELARESGIVVEITVEQRDLESALKTRGAGGIPFFRSTGLDSFSEDTPFRPNLKAEPFGRTCPRPPATKERPEVVSESTSYENLDENVRIILTGFRYQKTGETHNA
jgi:hypothetical protein